MSKEPLRHAHPREIKKFFELRDKGFSVEQAARSMGFSRSWGYKHENDRYKHPYVSGQAEAAPTIEEAIEYLEAATEDDPKAFLRLLERYGSNQVMQVHLRCLCLRLAEYASQLASQQSGEEVTIEATLQILRTGLSDPEAGNQVHRVAAVK